MNSGPLVLYVPRLVLRGKPAFSPSGSLCFDYSPLTSSWSISLFGFPMELPYVLPLSPPPDCFLLSRRMYINPPSALHLVRAPHRQGGN